MKKRILTIQMILTLLLIGTFGFAQTYFTATLTGNQENPAVVTSATGTGVFLLTDEGLKFSITVDGIEMTNAHFHKATAGMNGGVVRAILDDFDGNTASGIWTSSDVQPLTEDLVKDLLSGNLYVNVHSADNPSGELRGQILLSSGTAFSARLSGNQENPAVTTDATGTASFTLTEQGLVYSITTENITAVAAHFHRAGIGANGGVARALDFVGNTASGIWTKNDDQPLTEELITDLLLGNIYINVHTADNPGGEIRGQVNLNSGLDFSMNLSGDQVNPPINSDGKGAGAFTLTDAGLIYSITVDGLDITNAHFHNGPTEGAGGVVHAIFNNFVNNTARGVWRSTGENPLTIEMVAELMRGNIYVNVHTAAHPAGEIRGQLNLNTGTAFTAILSGNQSNPSIATDASGTGHFLLTEEGLEYTISVNGLAIANAHFHRASTGLNGGVVRSLADDFVGNSASGIWTSSDAQPLTDELIADLIAGNLYVNVHTGDNPGGEIRGQVLLSSGTSFTAHLNGAQENPAVATDAVGTGTFILTKAGLAFSVTVEGVDIANAHFHNNAIGANGGVAREILSGFVGNTATGLWTSNDAQPLTDAIISDLLKGNLYVNVHSPSNPGGEIRGQVIVNAGRGFAAKLEGGQEVPAVVSNASGTGSATLTEAGMIFNATVNNIVVGNAHFHNAPFGTNGGVARPIVDDFVGSTASFVWSPNDPAGLSNILMAELAAGNIYVNVHTAENPGGEIRGQLGPSEIVTGVKEIDNPIGNNEKNLRQNAPNPFSSTTEIVFNIEQSGDVVLKVFDFTGKEVGTLVNEYLNSGFYQVTFDGEYLPAGFYTYTLNAKNVNETKKMILQK